MGNYISIANLLNLRWKISDGKIKIFSNSFKEEINKLKTVALHDGKPLSVK